LQVPPNNVASSSIQVPLIKMAEIVSSLLGSIKVSETISKLFSKKDAIASEQEAKRSLSEGDEEPRKKQKKEKKEKKEKKASKKEKKEKAVADLEEKGPDEDLVKIVQDEAEDLEEIVQDEAEDLETSEKDTSSSPLKLDENTRKAKIEKLIEKNKRTVFVGNLPVTVIEKVIVFFLTLERNKTAQGTI
jgi:nucleolar protein 12